MKKFLLAIMVLFTFCCSGCGKQEDSMLQEEPALQGDSIPQEESSLQIEDIGDLDESELYWRLISLSDRSINSDWFPNYRAFLTREEIPDACWVFEFNDERIVEIYGVDISIKVEKIEELKAKYTIYKDNEEVDSFEAFLYHSSPPDMIALYVDINKDGSRDVVIIGSADSGGVEPTPWTYAYDVKNGEQIHMFDVDDKGDGCLTEKQKAQMKSILNEEAKLQELLSESKIWIDDSTILGGIPIVDACDHVYFELPIRGTRYHAEVCGSVLLLLTYNADTKEFDVCDIVYKIGSP